MLELGTPGSDGTERGERPVLRDGVVVATLRASKRRESAGRWASEPEEAVRLRAQQTSWWRSTWVLDLEGTAVDLEIASRWKGSHRYVSGGRTVAESGTPGGWSPRPTLTAGSELPLHHQVFLLWLELVLQRRAAGAAAA